jgi:hypothetical protein
MGRICWICFFWCANVEGCDSGKIMKNPNRPYLPNDIARCYGTVMFHLALHIHSTVVRMSVWSDSQQNRWLPTFWSSLFFWGLRKSSSCFLWEMRAKLIGQRMRSFAHGAPVEGRSDPRGLVAVPLLAMVL